MWMLVWTCTHIPVCSCVDLLYQWTCDFRVCVFIVWQWLKRSALLFMSNMSIYSSIKFHSRLDGIWSAYRSSIIIYSLLMKLLLFYIIIEKLHRHVLNIWIPFWLCLWWCTVKCQKASHFGNQFSHNLDKEGFGDARSLQKTDDVLKSQRGNN